ARLARGVVELVERLGDLLDLRVDPLERARLLGLEALAFAFGAHAALVEHAPLVGELRLDLDDVGFHRLALLDGDPAGGAGKTEGEKEEGLLHRNDSSARRLRAQAASF